jgi:hypothetical protein
MERHFISTVFTSTVLLMILSLQVCGVVDDDYTFEYGVEYINNYRNANDLWLCDDDATYMRTKLKNTFGWAERFYKGDGDAKQKHWAGENNDYVDKADLVMFRGHGTSSWDWTFWKTLHGPMFREPAWYESYDYILTPGEAYDRYGEKDVEWIAFGCCKPLVDGGGGYWATAFNGAHLILGFATNADHATYGTTWIQQMTSDGVWDPAKRVAFSWFEATRITQSNGVTARIIGENSTMAWDYLWGQGTGPMADPVDDDYYCKWDYTKGGSRDWLPEMAFLQSKETNGPTTMHYYEVTPRTINETYVENIGNIFGMSGTVHHDVNEGIFYMADGNKCLQVSEIEGISYGDTSKLWIPHDVAPPLLSLPQAKTQVTNFLNSHGLLPSDNNGSLAGYGTTQSIINKETGDIDANYPLDVQVSFNREIDGYPVVGPGSSCITLVGYGTPDINALGFSRIWRQKGTLHDVNIYTATEVNDLFNQYGSKIVLNGMPYYDEAIINKTGLGYYEDAFGKQQTYLFPVYILDVTFKVGGTVDSNDYVFIPAAAMFVKPIAEVNSPEDGSVHYYGESIEFNGLAYFGVSPYSYSWNSNVDGDLGTGQYISTSNLSKGRHIITLQVTDNNGQTATDSIDIVIVNPDLNEDGIVNFVDFAFFANKWLESSP